MPFPDNVGPAIGSMSNPSSRGAYEQRPSRPVATFADGYKSEYQFQLEMQEQIRKFDEMMGQVDTRLEANEGAWLLQGHPEMQSRKEMAERVMSASARGFDRGTFRPHAAPVNGAPVPAGPPPSGTVYALASGGMYMQQPRGSR